MVGKNVFSNPRILNRSHTFTLCTHKRLSCSCDDVYTHTHNEYTDKQRRGKRRARRRQEFFFRVSDFTSFESRSIHPARCWRVRVRFKAGPRKGFFAHLPFDCHWLFLLILIDRTGCGCLYIHSQQCTIQDRMRKLVDMVVDVAVVVDDIKGRKIPSQNCLNLGCLVLSKGDFVIL